MDLEFKYSQPLIVRNIGLADELKIPVNRNMVGSEDDLLNPGFLYSLRIKSFDGNELARIDLRLMSDEDGNYFLYFKEGHFNLYDLQSKKLTNISENIEISFIDITEDHPFENPSYGLAGWSADRKTVFLNHLYDIWAVALDGTGGYNLTGDFGTENEIRFRIQRTGGRGGGRFRSRSAAPGENPYIDLAKFLLGGVP